MLCLTPSPPLAQKVPVDVFSQRQSQEALPSLLTSAFQPLVAVPMAWKLGCFPGSGMVSFFLFQQWTLFITSSLDAALLGGGEPLS